MRDVKFRGKTTSEVWGGNQVKNGTWVYGFYRDKVGLPVISQFETERCDYIDYEIDRNTLGQYIGLKDKNGREIYEGDIVKINGVANAVIEYDNERMAFMFNWGNEGMPICVELSDERSIEVVGNVYDNLELLKEIR